MLYLLLPHGIDIDNDERITEKKGTYYLDIRTYVLFFSENYYHDDDQINLCNETKRTDVAVYVYMSNHVQSRSSQLVDIMYYLSQQTTKHK